MSNEQEKQNLTALVTIDAARTARVITIIGVVFNHIIAMIAFLTGMALFWMWVFELRWELVVLSVVWLFVSAIIYPRRDFQQKVK